MSPQSLRWTSSASWACFGRSSSTVWGRFGWGSLAQFCTQRAAPDYPQLPWPPLPSNFHSFPSRFSDTECQTGRRCSFEACKAVSYNTKLDRSAWGSADRRSSPNSATLAAPACPIPSHCRPCIGRFPNSEGASEVLCQPLPTSWGWSVPFVCAGRHVGVWSPATAWRSI